MYMFHSSTGAGPFTSTYFMAAVHAAYVYGKAALEDNPALESGEPTQVVHVSISQLAFVYYKVRVARGHQVMSGGHASPVVPNILHGKTCIRNDLLAGGYIPNPLYCRCPICPVCRSSKGFSHAFQMRGQGWPHSTSHPSGTWRSVTAWRCARAATLQCAPSCTLSGTCPTQQRQWQQQTSHK
jgi:hypothetical protein